MVEKIVYASVLDGIYNAYDGIPQLSVERGLVPWWYENDRRPEYSKHIRSIDPRRTRVGFGSQHWFSTYAAVTSGVYVPINIIPINGELVAKANIMVFTRNDSEDDNRSTGRLYVKLGICPYGDVDPKSPRIVWSNVHAPYDRFEVLTVSCPVVSNRATLWVWSQSEWAFKHNDVWLDVLSLQHRYDDDHDDDNNELYDVLFGGLIAIRDYARDLAIELTEMIDKRKENEE